MARSGDSIETRIGLRGGQEVRQQLEQLGRAGETALRQIGGAIGDSSNAFARLSTGADEVRRHMERLALAGQNSGNSIRASLLAATQGVNSFSAGTKTLGASSGQLRFALQNLSFQVNDVATSLASGSDPMRVFAQQSGQIFQAFQVGGGPRAVFGAAATAIGSMITPLTVAAAAAVALAAGLALIIARAASAQASARQFDVILKGLGKSSEGTGKQLEEASHRLRDVGLSAEEAQKAFRSAIQQGIKPSEAERIVRIGQDLNTVLGEGSAEKFIAAVAKGGEPLREFGERLGIIPKAAADAATQLQGTAGAVSEASKAIQAALSNRNQAIVDQQRQAAAQIVELTRKKGTDEAEIEYASKKRILEINRASVLAINELLNQRNLDNTKKLAEYNKQIEEAAQKALEAGQALIKQIEEKTKGANASALGPLGEAMRQLGIAWDDMMTEFAKDEVIQQMIRGFTNLLKVVTELIKALNQVPGLGGGQTDFGGGGDITGRARGGFIRGAGTGTSDSILSWLSDGEFVNTAKAVRFWGTGVFEALNRLQNPFQGFSIGGLVDAINTPMIPRGRGFATGGLAAAGAGGTPVHLHLPGGGSFGLRGDQDVVEALVKRARRAKMLSAGRAPSSVG